MDLSELQVFLTVASERSFSRAAAKLHRTQPAVSQAIRRLEDELGERLFDRSSKQGALTEVGRVLRERHGVKDVLMFTKPYFGTPVEPTQTQRIFEECDFAITAIGD
jgi:hypothetical protein